MTKVQVNGQGKVYVANGKALLATESSGIGIPREVSAQGVYGQSTQITSFNLPSNATTIISYGLAYAFIYNHNLTSIDLSSITQLSGSNNCYCMCQSCDALSNIYLSNLVTINSSNGLGFAFSGCTALTSVDLSKLTTISQYGGMYYTFMVCNHLTSVNLSALTTISGGNGLSGCFQNCSSLQTISFPSLSDISGGSALYTCFQACTALTDIYFNALTTTSFGSYTNQFQNMLSSTGTNVTHTLHFPSNLESTIQGLTGYPLFGGTSGYVTLSFDLPATS